jgi:hypothetical protein
MKMLLGCEFLEQRVVNNKIEASVTALDRMTDLIAFSLVEEQHLIGFSHSIVAAYMAHKHAAIREY